MSPGGLHKNSSKNNLLSAVQAAETGTSLGDTNLAKDGYMQVGLPKQGNGKVIIVNKCGQAYMKNPNPNVSP